MRKIQQRHRVPIEDLDFLASKFLLIIPEHLHGDRARIGFQLEKAFWRYINQFEEEKVARMENYFQLKDFAQQIFPRVPFLRHHVDIVEEVIADFMDYKRSVPTYGVILLNSSLDKVLLVQSYKRKRWGFPKGKVNENERGEVCAAREAEEEIGLNVDELLDPDTWCEQVINDQLVRLYIVPNQRAPEGLPETTVFKTKTKFEIGNIQWFSLVDVDQRSCYNARPFLRDIEAFVGGFKKSTLLRKANPRKPAEETLKEEMDNKEDFIEKLADGSLMCDDCDLNVDNTDEMKNHKQRDHNNQRWSSLKEDFIPRAWINFSLDHEHLLELSLQFD